MRWLTLLSAPCFHTHARPEQEAILHLAETLGRLLLLHDKAGMGLLSERELLSAWQDLALTAGTGIPRRCIRFAARFSRVRGEQISQQSRAGHGGGANGRWRRGRAGQRCTAPAFS